jgi:branched-chain amino acid transport system ATP-binding protein
MLEVENLSKSFRGLRAVEDVSFSVPRGGIVGLIGPNGAGKTTTFNLVAGALPPSSGRVRLDGADITGLAPDRACRAGIGRTFQIVKPFGALSVLDNVTVGALHRRRDVAEARDAARDLLDRLGLGPKADLPASGLTLPDRKRLETARALATQPKILLLDEVMAGLRPIEVDAMIETLRDLCARTGLTILLIEHVMRAVMALCETIVVLHHGKRIAVGPPEAIVRDPQVLECYLGEAAP